MRPEAAKSTHVSVLGLTASMTRPMRADADTTTACRSSRWSAPPVTAVSTKNSPPSALLLRNVKQEGCEHHGQEQNAGLGGSIA